MHPFVYFFFSLLTVDCLLCSVSNNLTVLAVLVLCMCLCIPAWVACRGADISSGESQKVHYLPDNRPYDSYLYAVSIHTGLQSAAQMSAKVKVKSPHLTASLSEKQIIFYIFILYFTLFSFGEIIHTNYKK